MWFSPVFSSFFAYTRSRTAATGRFLEKSLLPGQRPLGLGWTMVAYVSTYKSRIVRSPMFSRPHINPGGEKVMHPVIVQWLTPLNSVNPNFLFIRLRSIRSRLISDGTLQNVRNSLLVAQINLYRRYILKLYKKRRTLFVQSLFNNLGVQYLRIIIFNR